MRNALGELRGDYLIRLLFSFEGRTGRRGWWLGVLILIVAGELCGVAPSPILASLVAAVLLFPSASLDAKRLHDLGRSAWWQAPVLAFQAIGVVPDGFIRLKQWADRFSATADFPRETSNAVVLALALAGVVYWLFLAFHGGQTGGNRFDQAEEDAVAAVFA